MANPNNRLYFAITQVGIRGDGSETQTVMHGVQTVGMTTNFAIENIQEMGQLAVYETKEEIPTVDVTMDKNLDGYPLIYHAATIDAPAPDLAGRSTAKCVISVAYFSETLSFSTGTPASQVQVSGAQITSLGYNFPLRGDENETVSFQAYDKVWANDPRMVQSAPWNGSKTLTFTGAFDGTDSPVGSGGVNRRQNLLFAYNASDILDNAGMVANPDATILPPEVYGISASGTNDLQANGSYNAHVGDITVRCTLNRDPLFEQGKFGPYAKTVTFPVETTCEITTIAVSGDMVSATQGGILNASNVTCGRNRNLANRTIRIANCEGTRLYLGTKCKLSAINQNGGDARGGNVAVSYTFLSYNTFTVIHSGDPNTNGATWWTNRGTYLIN